MTTNISFFGIQPSSTTLPNTTATTSSTLITTHNNTNNTNKSTYSTTSTHVDTITLYEKDVQINSTLDPPLLI